MRESHKAFDELRKTFLTGEMVWNFADFMTTAGRDIFIFYLFNPFTSTGPLPMPELQTSNYTYVHKFEFMQLHNQVSYLMQGQSEFQITASQSASCISVLKPSFIINSAWNRNLVWSGYKLENSTCNSQAQGTWKG